MLKSITTRGIFGKHPEAKKQLWGAEFWTDVYYVSTVGIHGNENAISKYVREQGVEKEYKALHKAVSSVSSDTPSACSGVVYKKGMDRFFH